MYVNCYAYSKLPVTYWRNVFECKLSLQTWPYPRPLGHPPLHYNTVHCTYTYICVYMYSALTSCGHPIRRATRMYVLVYKYNILNYN